MSRSHVWRSIVVACMAIALTYGASPPFAWAEDDPSATVVQLAQGKGKGKDKDRLEGAPGKAKKGRQEADQAAPEPSSAPTPPPQGQCDLAAVLRGPSSGATLHSEPFDWGVLFRNVGDAPCPGNRVSIERTPDESGAGGLLADSTSEQSLAPLAPGEQQQLVFRENGPPISGTATYAIRYATPHSDANDANHQEQRTLHFEPPQFEVPPAPAPSEPSAGDLAGGECDLTARFVAPQANATLPGEQPVRWQTRFENAGGGTCPRNSVYLSRVSGTTGTGTGLIVGGSRNRMVLEALEAGASQEIDIPEATTPKTGVYTYVLKYSSAHNDADNQNHRPRQTVRYQDPGAAPLAVPIQPKITSITSAKGGYSIAGAHFGSDPAQVVVYEAGAALPPDAVVSVQDAAILVRSAATQPVGVFVEVAGVRSPVTIFEPTAPPGDGGSGAIKALSPGTFTVAVTDSPSGVECVEVCIWQMSGTQFTTQIGATRSTGSNGQATFQLPQAYDRIGVLAAKGGASRKKVATQGTGVSLSIVSGQQLTPQCEPLQVACGETPPPPPPTSPDGSPHYLSGLPAPQHLSLAEKKAWIEAQLRTYKDIFAHPRCTNCHGGVNPSTGLNHQQLSETTEGKPQPCSDCHIDETVKNHWTLANNKFVDRSYYEICQDINETAQVANREVWEHHVKDDPLIQWAFAPTPPYKDSEAVPADFAFFVEYSKQLYVDGQGRIVCFGSSADGGN